METKLQAVRAKVIEAVPEIAEESCGNCGYPMDGGYCSVLDGEGEGQPHCPGPSTERPITLADVLRAIEGDLFVCTTGQLLTCEGQTGNSSWDVELTGITWNLALPLDEQETEVIEFLYKTLIK